MTDLRRGVVGLVIVSFSVAALLGIAVLVGGADLDDTGARVLLTTVVVGLESMAALCYLALAGHRLALVGVAGGAASVVATALALWTTWVGDVDAWQVQAIATTLAASLAPASLLLALAGRRRVGPGLAATLLSVAAVAILVIVPIVDASGLGDAYWRLLGVVAILDVLGTVVTAALGSDRRSGDDRSAPSVPLLGPDVAARVAEVARRRGTSPDGLVSEALAALLAGSGQSEDGPSTAWERVGAALYDPFLARAERRGMARRRAALVGEAHGDVLEIGAGTGLNVAHYPRTGGRLVLTEPVAPMVDRLRRRAATREDLDDLGGVGDIEVVPAPAEALPFADASFDTVVSTLVLCTVRSPDAALAEVARVLRPGGRLLFAEHVHADGRLGRRQRRWARPWAAFAGGCRCDRDLLAAVGARFDVAELERAEWRGMPSIVRPLVIGAARPRGGLDSDRAEPAQRGAARPSRGR